MTRGLPTVSGSEAAKVLNKAGFQRTSQRGSHLKLRNAEGRTVIVPLHRELAMGTLRSILRQAGLSEEDFYELL